LVPESRGGSFARFFFCGLPKAYTRATAVLVDELYATGLQGSANGNVVRCSHGGFSLGKFGTADRCKAAVSTYWMWPPAMVIPEKVNVSLPALKFITASVPPPAAESATLVKRKLSQSAAVVSFYLPRAGTGCSFPA
jgi:hypothetical protein